MENEIQSDIDACERFVYEALRRGPISFDELRRSYYRENLEGREYSPAVLKQHAKCFMVALISAEASRRIECHDGTYSIVH
jgi:hypothetical protein